MNSPITVASAKLAERFFQELHDATESLGAIAEQHGIATLVDLMYLHNAILKNRLIDHEKDSASSVLDILKDLHSGATWRRYVHTEDGPADPPDTEGSALEPASGIDHYLLVVRGDVEPELHGPYSSDGARVIAARSHREEDGSEDGLYRLDVPVGAVVNVSSFGGDELEPELDPVTAYLVEALNAGETPIERLTMPGCIPQFTVSFEGDELIYTEDMHIRLTEALFSQLYLLDRPASQVLATEETARNECPPEQWVAEVNSGQTQLGYFNWWLDKIKSRRVDTYQQLAAT